MVEILVLKYDTFSLIPGFSRKAGTHRKKRTERDTCEQ